MIGRKLPLMRDEGFDCRVRESKAFADRLDRRSGEWPFTTQQLRQRRVVHSQPSCKRAQGVTRVSGAVLCEDALQMHPKTGIHGLNHTDAAMVIQGRGGTAPFKPGHRGCPMNFMSRNENVCGVETSKAK